jgi:hypothetical protein
VCIIAAVIAVFDDCRIGTSSTLIQKIGNAGFVFLLAGGYFAYAGWDALFSDGDGGFYNNPSY